MGEERGGDGIEWIALESSSSSHWPLSGSLPLAPAGRIDEEFGCWISFPIP